MVLNIRNVQLSFKATMTRLARMAAGVVKFRRHIKATHRGMHGTDRLAVV